MRRVESSEGELLALPIHPAAPEELAPDVVAAIHVLAALLGGGPACLVRGISKREHASVVRCPLPNRPPPQSVAATAAQAAWFAVSAGGPQASDPVQSCPVNTQLVVSGGAG